MPETPQKVCVVCGQDCAGQPRMKDAKGRYVHQACAAKAKKKKPAGDTPSAPPAQAPTHAHTQAPSGGVMDQLVDEALADAPLPCDSCGRPIAHSAVICIHCGYNRETGKKIRAQVEKYRPPSKTGAAAASVGRAGLVAATPLFVIAGAGLGALLGGFVWYWLVKTTQYEIGYVAVGVGVVTALGAQIGARGQGNVVYGVFAAVLALAGIAGARYAFIDDIVTQIEEGAFFELEDITEQDAKQTLVDEIAEQRIADGQTVRLPDAGVSLEYAIWPDDYPKYLQDETNERWDAMSSAERRELRERSLTRITSGFEINHDEAVEFGFVSSLGLIDIVFVVLAVGAAFGGASKSFDEVALGD